MHCSAWLIFGQVETGQQEEHDECSKSVPSNLETKAQQATSECYEVKDQELPHEKPVIESTMCDHDPLPGEVS